MCQFDAFLTTMQELLGRLLIIISRQCALVHLSQVRLVLTWQLLLGWVLWSVTRDTWVSLVSQGGTNRKSLMIFLVKFGTRLNVGGINSY